jgi:hypothetical protein
MQQVMHKMICNNGFEKSRQHVGVLAIKVAKMVMTTFVTIL